MCVLEPAIAKGRGAVSSSWGSVKLAALDSLLGFTDSNFFIYYKDFNSEINRVRHFFFKMFIHLTIQGRNIYETCKMSD